MKHELRNTVARRVLKEKATQESLPRVTLSFYRYVSIADPVALRDTLFAEWSMLGVLGRIYLAHEGINAQLNVPEDRFEEFKKNLESRTEFKNMPFKIAVEDGLSFIKLTIKVRKQIVADGLPAGTYDVSDVGTHLTPEEFHSALQDPNVIAVDVRNRYESRIGHFEGALLPEAQTFRDELPLIKEMLKGKEDKKVILYCTGGIRCEKASSFLKHAGFKNVSQLYGGVINYAHVAKEKGLPSAFKGKNFVFDDRLSERVTEDILSSCDQCGEKSDEYVNCANEMCNRLFIQCKGCTTRFAQCCSIECKEVAALPEEIRRTMRKKQKKNTATFCNSITPPTL